MAKFTDKMQNIEYSMFKFAKRATNFKSIFEVGAVQRLADLVDLEKF